MHELNKTCYTVGTSFLSSRKYSCLKVKLGEIDIKNKDSTQLNDLCKTLINRKECEFFANKDYNFEGFNDIEDIEDLFKEAKS